MNLHVLGAGSIGCLFAHHLAAAGWRVSLLLRPPALAAFDAAGRGVRVGGGNPVACGAEDVTQQQAGAPPIDNLLVTTQAGQTEGALATVAHRLRPSSVVILLQNGVLAVHEQLLASDVLKPQGGAVAGTGAVAGAGAAAATGTGAGAAAARPQFLLGSTTHGAWRRAPFDVVWHPGSAVFGRPLGAGGSSDGSGGSGGGGGGEGGRPADRGGEVLRALASPALGALNIDAGLSPERLHEQLLAKLLVNAAVNPLAALLRCRNAGLLGNGPARELMARVVAECRAVFGGEIGGGGGGNSSGGGESSGGEGGRLRGSQDELMARVEAVLAATAGNVNSMLQAVSKGMPTEIDYINGYVVRHAAAKGVPAPLNATLARLVSAAEAVAPEHAFFPQPPGPGGGTGGDGGGSGLREAPGR